jgi:hypothetical protein
VDGPNSPNWKEKCNITKVDNDKFHVIEASFSSSIGSSTCLKKNQASNLADEP